MCLRGREGDRERVCNNDRERGREIGEEKEVWLRVREGRKSGR